MADSSSRWTLAADEVLVPMNQVEAQEQEISYVQTRSSKRDQIVTWERRCRSPTQSNITKKPKTPTRTCLNARARLSNGAWVSVFVVSLLIYIISFRSLMSFDRIRLPLKCSEIVTKPQPQRLEIALLCSNDSPSRSAYLSHTSVLSRLHPSETSFIIHSTPRATCVHL